MICLINIITTNTCSLFGMWCRWVEGWGAGLTLISRMIYHLGAPNIFLEDLGDKKSKFYAMCFYLFKRVGPQMVVNYIWKSTIWFECDLEWGEISQKHETKQLYWSGNQWQPWVSGVMRCAVHELDMDIICV